MQKKQVWIPAAILILALSCAQAWAADLKVGVVDLQKAMESSEEGQKAKAVFQKQVEKIQRELKAQQDELASIKENMERQGMMLSDSARMEKERAYQEKLRKFKRTYEDYQEEMRQEDAKLSEKILRQLIEVIETVGKKDGYDIILEKTQSAVLYRSDKLDITDKVIQIFDKTTRK